MVQKSRVAGRVSYDLRVKLKESAPPGFVKDQLILVSNDQQSATFPIDVEGRVVPELTISQLINFGSLDAGGKATKPLVVRGQKLLMTLAVPAGGTAKLAAAAHMPAASGTGRTAGHEHPDGGAHHRK